MPALQLEKNNIMEEFGLEGLKEFKRKVKFGDFVINHWASERNPTRIGVFVKFKKVGGNNSIECTDMKGKFWTPALDYHAKLEILENIVKPKLKNEIKLGLNCPAVPSKNRCECNKSCWF